MLSLRPEKLIGTSIPVATSWLLSACMEAKGKQDLWVRQKPELLESLREQAMIQSAESSNRIEGVIVEPARLRPIVLGKSKPRDRSEEEVVGYRKALNWMYSRKRPVEVEPDMVLHLHSLAQGGFSGDAGKWKSKDNEIIEILPNNERKVRFRPTPAKETPGAIEDLCRAYSDAENEERIPALLAAATFVFDFLCIHPFRDGNGRVSRLLTSFFLQRHGFVVGRYVSLERLAEETKEDYYNVLARCSAGWHDGENEMVPWWNYFLSILKQAYGDFARQVEAAGNGLGKGDLVRLVVQRQVGSFRLSELAAQCPSVSVALVKRVLREMKDAGEVKLTGHGRGALWENVKRK